MKYIYNNIINIYIYYNNEKVCEFIIIIIIIIIILLIIYTINIPGNSNICIIIIHSTSLYSVHVVCMQQWDVDVIV